MLSPPAPFRSVDLSSLKIRDFEKIAMIGAIVLTMHRTTKTNTLETAGTYGATPLRSEAIPARANWVFALTKKRIKSASVKRFSGELITDIFHEIEDEKKPTEKRLQLLTKNKFERESKEIGVIYAVVTREVDQRGADQSIKVPNVSALEFAKRFMAYSIRLHFTLILCPFGFSVLSLLFWSFHFPVFGTASQFAVFVQFWLAFPDLGVLTAEQYGMSNGTTASLRIESCECMVGPEPEMSAGRGFRLVDVLVGDVY
ncbi:hypothetical protein QVD17_42421 [Tagetes erecta]|uniref:Uncharacterized protein n=1 Tax=Tagetes erecta TaxID=13708 RepID=A0AAD8JK10_TARER|nr:hypothetical protein QVD17_42421 [Tagetes erecta]